MFFKSSSCNIRDLQIIGCGTFNFPHTLSVTFDVLKQLFYLLTQIPFPIGEQRVLCYASLLINSQGKLHL